MISFWSYKAEYKKNKKKIISAIDNSLKSGVTFFGENINKFEKDFTKKYKSNYGIAVGSGTDALLISLIAIGIKRGDEVITAANTAIPTISAILTAGAVPKLVDINKNDYLIDADKIKKKITSKTKAIIPVHLYGQSADMQKILKIAKKFKLKVIEDCAQAQGAKYKNQYVGTIGDFGCFSFYPTKILGTYGDGGFILTKNKKMYEKIRRIRFYGIETTNKKNKFFNKYYANEYGLNSRLDEIQASILNLKLKEVDLYIKRRRQIAMLYKKRLSKTDLFLPVENTNNFHVYRLFTVFHPHSKKIIKSLNIKNIQVRVIYPYPINTMNGFKFLKYKEKDYYTSMHVSKNIFCLPLYPELTDKSVNKICKEIINILNYLKKKN